MFDNLVTEFFGIWPSILLSDVLRYLIPAALMTAILAVFADQLATRRIQGRRATHVDQFREIRYSLMTAVIFSLSGFLIYLGAEAGVLRIQAGFVPGLIAGILQATLIIVAHDAYFYWMHRGIHHPKVFRHVHRVHHLSRTPTPWAAYAFAPLEAVAEAAFLPLFLLCFETSGLVITVFLIHMILRNVMGHAGIELFPKNWLRSPILRAMTTTTHHDLHHDEFRWNYGLYFSWWDRWMGTEHPEYRARFEAVTETQTRSKSRRSVAILPLVFVAALTASDAVESASIPDSSDASNAIDGLWVTPGFGAIVRVSVPADSDRLVGRVIWVMDEDDAAAINASIFRDMRWRDTAWQGGEIFNPDNGKTYRGSVRKQDADLLVRGCLGPFCQTQRWRRYRSILARLPEVPSVDVGG